MEAEGGLHFHFDFPLLFYKCKCMRKHLVHKRQWRINLLSFSNPRKLMKTLRFLSDKGIDSFNVFELLKCEHFQKFLKRRATTLGQHALMWRCWEELVVPGSLKQSTKVRTSSLNTTSTGGKLTFFQKIMYHESANFMQLHHC